MYGKISQKLKLKYLATDIMSCESIDEEVRQTTHQLVLMIQRAITNT